MHGGKIHNQNSTAVVYFVGSYLMYYSVDIISRFLSHRNPDRGRLDRYAHAVEVDRHGQGTAVETNTTLATNAMSICSLNVGLWLPVSL